MFGRRPKTRAAKATATAVGGPVVAKNFNKIAMVASH